MRIVALASGSSGNAVLVDDGRTRILVDCGIGPRTLAQRLDAAGASPHDIEAVVLTHEHTDHTRGLEAAVRRYGWSVFGTSGTLARLPASVRQHARQVRERAHIGDLDLELIPVAHDATEPTAYTVTSRRTGIRAGIAHDLGHASDRLVRAFHGVELLCIEANHDEDMLRDGPYPAYLKARIASAAGHLSNEQATAFIAAVSTSSLRAVLLLHLSEVNNTPDAACTATRRAIARRCRRVTLAPAARLATSQPIGDAVGPQLSLAF